MNRLVNESTLLHVLLFVLENEHLHAFVLELAQYLHVAVETVIVARVGLPLGSDHVDELLKLVLLEVVHLVAVYYQVYCSTGWTPAT